MKRKKKSLSGMTAICILALGFSVNSIVCAAEENLLSDTSVLSEYRIPAEEIWMEDYLKYIDNYNSLVSNDISEYNDVLDMPIYLVLITNEEESYLTTGFYVEDTNHSGNTYLVTTILADTFEEEGYSIYLYKDGYSEEVTDVDLDSSGTFAYLTAPGIENEIPLEIAKSASVSNQAMLQLGMEDDGSYYLSYTEIPLDTFEEYGEYFVGDSQIEDLLWLGSPVVDLETFEVMGMVQMTSEMNIVVNKMAEYDFSSGTAVTTGSQSAGQTESEEVEEEQAKTEEQTEESGTESPTEEEQIEETAPTSEEGNETSEEGSKIPGWIVVAVVIILAAAIMNGKNKKKNETKEEKKISDSYQEGTVPLEPKETIVQEAVMEEVETLPVVRAVAHPQVGAIYRADKEGRIVFGRENSCQVRFEENDTKISKRHCVLYKTNQGLFLMDTGSTNGTFVSENARLRPNEPYPIQKGTAFFLSSPKYTFVITED